MKNTLILNHAERTIVMDKTFAKFAANTMSAEYAHLQQVLQDYPLYTVVQRHMSSCGMNRQWQRIKRKIDVHGATPHVFRHTFATLIQPHTDIKTLQTIMGHSDIETTLDRYTHFVHENVAALAQINPYCNTPVTTNAPQSQ